MSLRLIQSADFLLDIEQQLDWYIYESKLDLADAIELAQKFKIAVEESSEFLLGNAGVGRQRFPQFTDLKDMRSWRVNPPFGRFLIYYHFNDYELFADRLIEGHRRIAQ